jgi:hypothetical protein
MYAINFIACAIGKIYEEFIVPFIFFALQSNPDSFVEAIVVDVAAFCRTFEKELESLREICGDRYLIRGFSRPLNHHIPNTYRFLEVPTVPATYTYIADIDIMFLEPIVENYLKMWPKGDPKPPYNNLVRKGTTRMTGVHFVITDQYFTEALKQNQTVLYNSSSTNDEMILYQLCKLTFGSIDLQYGWRRILGIHFSPNRGPAKAMELITTPTYTKKFKEYLEGYPTLQKYPCFMNLVKQLSTIFKCV